MMKRMMMMMKILDMINGKVCPHDDGNVKDINDDHDDDYDDEDAHDDTGYDNW